MPVVTAFRRYGGKLATFGAGLAIKKSLDYAFDYGIYPAALIYCGYLWGGILMTIASILINLAVILAYDLTKRDWLMLETIKELRHNSTGDGGVISWVLHKGDLPAFFILSSVEDPLVTTLYLRHGAHLFNGLSSRDRMIFCASTVVSNLVWILSVVSVIEIFRFVF